MKLRLLATLVAAVALSGCATYDYAGGSGSGGYYHGRAPAEYYYGPYGGAYSYPGYGNYGHGRYRYGPRYYGPRGYGYRPPYYYPYRPPHYPHPRPPRDDGDRSDRGDDRPPPWRRPDGRYHDTGRVMVPPRHAPMPEAPTGPSRDDSERMSPWRSIAPPPSDPSPAEPRAEPSRPAPQVQRDSAPPWRESSGQEQFPQEEP